GRGDKRCVDMVGIAKNTRVASLRAAPPSTVYVAYAQLTGDFPTTLEVRAAGPLGPVAAAVRGALQSRLPNAPIEVRQFSTQVSATLLQERMMATLAGAFGMLALTLVSVGLYGLLAYTVARRTREIGIRMALGAQRLRVVMLILNGAARLVVIGIVVGLPAAWAASRWVQSMLFGLTPPDPIAIVGPTLFPPFAPRLLSAGVAGVACQSADRAAARVARLFCVAQGFSPAEPAALKGCATSCLVDLLSAHV